MEEASLAGDVGQDVVHQVESPDIGVPGASRQSRPTGAPHLVVLEVAKGSGFVGVQLPNLCVQRRQTALVNLHHFVDVL